MRPHPWAQLEKIQHHLPLHALDKLDLFVGPPNSESAQLSSRDLNLTAVLHQEWCAHGTSSSAAGRAATLLTVRAHADGVPARTERQEREISQRYRQAGR